MQYPTPNLSQVFLATLVQQITLHLDNFTQSIHITLLLIKTQQTFWKSHQETWRQLFWDVLFPLLENVENEIKMADKSKSSDSKNFLVHHSRDTKEKQWAETKRLTLNGLAKLFKGNSRIELGSSCFNF